MKEFIRRLYKVVMPKAVRARIEIYRAPDRLKLLRNNIINYYRAIPKDDLSTEQKTILSYLRENPLTVFPYKFQDTYDPDHVVVHFDINLGMRYVIFQGKKLYFKRRWSVVQIKKSMTDLLKEQDVNSPHHYLTSQFKVEKDDVVLDIGAAEGNFSLANVETAKQVYLFEYDSEWVEALRATFEPWKDKVVIVNKFVSDKSDEARVKLDDLFPEPMLVDFIKIDVEGAELSVLNGAKNILNRNNPMKMALCVYHRQNDAERFAEELKNYRFDIEYSKGYMIFFYDKAQSPPYLRRGLIRAEKLR